MTLKELQDRYYMHDSYFEKIIYDKSRNEVELLINFAYWMQDWYKDTDPENALLRCTFKGVSLYDHTWDEIDCKTLGILKTDVTDNTVTFALDDISDDYHELKITAESVDVQEYTKA